MNASDIMRRPVVAATPSATARVCGLILPSIEPGS